MSRFGYSDWSYDPFETMVIFPPNPLAVWVVLVQNSSQSVPLLQMKFVISRETWYVTACWRGMVLVWMNFPAYGLVKNHKTTKTMKFCTMSTQEQVGRLNKCYEASGNL
jgi:hypothetical protein